MPNFHYTSRRNKTPNLWYGFPHSNHSHKMSLTKKQQILDLNDKTGWYGLLMWQTTKMAMIQPQTTHVKTDTPQTYY